MDIYEEIHVKRAERQAKRERVLARRLMVKKIIRPLVLMGQMVLAVAMLYAYLFMTALADCM